MSALEVKKMTLMERKLRKNQHDDAKFRRLAREMVEEALCFFGTLAWMAFLGYLLAGAVFER